MPHNDHHLYFSDFLLEANLSQCEWCGALVEDKDLKLVQVDHREQWHNVCSPCLEAYDWKHSAY